MYASERTERSRRHSLGDRGAGVGPGSRHGNGVLHRRNVIPAKGGGESPGQVRSADVPATGSSARRRPISPALCRRRLVERRHTRGDPGHGSGRGQPPRLQGRSRLRPYSGTLGDVADLAPPNRRRPRARGVGLGDLVAFQLPNWVEAAATFWATAFLGAVPVPIVHFYGVKEVGFILRQSGAASS